MREQRDRPVVEQIHAVDHERDAGRSSSGEVGGDVHPPAVDQRVRDVDDHGRGLGVERVGPQRFGGQFEGQRRAPGARLTGYGDGRRRRPDRGRAGRCRCEEGAEAEQRGSAGTGHRFDGDLDLGARDECQRQRRRTQRRVGGDRPQRADVGGGEQFGGQGIGELQVVADRGHRDVPARGGALEGVEHAALVRTGPVEQPVGEAWRSVRIEQLAVNRIRRYCPRSRSIRVDKCHTVRQPHIQGRAHK